MGGVVHLEDTLVCPFCGTMPKYLDDKETLIDFDPDYHSELFSPDEIEDLIDGEEVEVSGYAVYCFKCKARGPEELFRKDAITAWNIRYPSSP